MVLEVCRLPLEYLAFPFQPFVLGHFQQFLQEGKKLGSAAALQFLQERGHPFMRLFLVTK
jgi:hypothetical protein